jgi:radical SAM protein with 4Fe4S-binding SPASM domain
MFDKLLNGIEILRSMNITFTFFVVVCRNNKDHLAEIVEFARSTGASQITFSSLLPQGGALDHLDDLFLTFEEEKRVVSEMRRLIKIYPELVGGSLVQGIRMMDRVSQIDLSELSSSFARRITSCGGSVTECSIRPEGWVIPCDRLWDYRVGNVKDETFQDIWLHSNGFRQFRMRYSRTMDSFAECQGCQYTPVCKGGCPAVPYNTGKGIEGWDPHSCYRVFTGEKESYI